MKFYDPFAPGHDHLYRPSPPVPGIPQWTLTIADLFSLILTFFVLLYSMTSIEQEKWQKISDSLRERMAQVEEKASFRDGPQMRSIEQVQPDPARNIDYIGIVIGQRFGELPGVSVSHDIDRVVISLAFDQLPHSRSQERASAAADTIAQLSGFLSNIDNAVSVETYTAGTDAGQTSSDWERSLALGEVVARLMRRAGYDRPVDIYATGNAAATGIAGSSAGTGKQRVDIVIRENVANF